MILTAAVLSTGSVVLIGVGSAAAGALIGVGSYKIYKMYFDSDNPDVQREMRLIDRDVRQNLRRETETFSTQTRQATSQITQTTNNLLSNQEAIEYIENLLKKDGETMHENHQNVQVVIVDLEEANRILNQVLQGYGEQKNQINQLTEDVTALNQKFATLYQELVASASQYQGLQKSITYATGERDYTGKTIGFIRRMKLSNTELETKLEKLTADYKTKAAVVDKQSVQIAALFNTIEEQKKQLDATKAELANLKDPPKNSITTPAFFK